MKVTELENICNRLLKSDKPKIIAGVFKVVEEISNEQMSHLISNTKNGRYLYQASPHTQKDEYFGLYMAVLLDETLNYVHLIFVSEEVLNLILDK